MLMLLTGMGGGANQQKYSSERRVSRARLQGRIMDFIVCLEVHSQLPPALSCSELWFLLVRFVWTWDLLDHTHTSSMVLVSQTISSDRLSLV